MIMKLPSAAGGQTKRLLTHPKMLTKLGPGEPAWSRATASRPALPEVSNVRPGLDGLNTRAAVTSGGPWDGNMEEDENVPDYDEYQRYGSYYLPFLKGIELRSIWGPRGRGWGKP